MTAEEYVDHLFGVAVGWLGWTPRVALTTPIPQIQVALRARTKWIAMCNGEPFQEISKSDRIKQQFRKLKAVKGL